MEVVSLPLTHPAFVFIVLFFVILVAPLAAERMGVPGLIGLIVAGIIVGPHVTGLLEREGAIRVVGDAGLLYLMFLVGLDLDRESFREHRRSSLVFTATTFAIPMVLVTLAGNWVGLSLVGALIVASAFTSHTPITYPLVQRFGLARTPALVATNGATLRATTAALLVFAAIAAAAGDGAGLGFWAILAVSLALFLWGTLRGLPRLTKWFFSGLGQDRIVRFVYVLVILFGTAAVAEILGIQAIVGAFLAGLALERFVPHGSLLRERVQFLGTAFLVPIFLVSTGMLVDPVTFVTDPQRLAIGLGLTAAAVGAKALAAGAAAGILRYSRAQLGMMTSLSVAQAAGALAVVLVAVEQDLVQERALDAVILVILISCLASSYVGSRYVAHLERPARRPPTLGETIVVPIANPDTAGPLVDIAGLLAAQDSGKVLAVNVLGYEASADELDEHREATENAEQKALSRGADASSLVRIDSTPTEGVLHTVVENNATLLVLGWKGYANAREHFFGGVIDAVLRQVKVPALVCRPGQDERITRIVLVVTRSDLTPAGRLDLDLSSRVAVRLAREAGVPLLIMSQVEDQRLQEIVTESGDARDVELLVDSRRPTDFLTELSRPGDLIIVGTPPTRPGIGHDAERVARAVADRTVVVTVPR
jgi:Kef-type K+ transport system membrane component KefB/nucleotide-binding universal stress UspA family protein